jgi:hypothetical protein
MSVLGAIDRVLTMMGRLFAPEQAVRVITGQHAPKLWPDGEAPLIDARLFGFRDGGLAPEVWATMPQQSSVGSTASEAAVDPVAEGPTPGRAHTPGVGRTKVTNYLLLSAAIGLREFADSDTCEAPVYWRSVAAQLDPK